MCTPKNEIRFHFDWKDHWVDAEDAERSAKDIMHMSAGRVMNVQNCFNDLSLYRWLKSTKGCTRVDLVRVHVYHSESFVFGLQAIYQVTYFNGLTREIAAEKHVYASGMYAQGRAPQVSTLELMEDEFISKCLTSQGEIVDSITFVTSKRRVKFGGDGGIEQDETDHFDGVMSRVVALTGTKAGALERIGYFMEPVNWETIRDVVLVRRLLELERAQHYDSPTSVEYTNEQVLLNVVLRRADDDIFRRVLSFLIYKTKQAERSA